MSKFGKLLLTILLSFMILPLPWSGIQAASIGTGFPDLPPSHWAYDTMIWAQEKGIIKGMPNGHAEPDRPVTQSEFTAMIIRYFVPNSDYEEDYASIQVPPGSAWDLRDYTYALYMNWAVSQDKRQAAMTRGEVAELLTSVMGLNCSRNGSIQYLLEKGYSKGKTSATIIGYQADDTLSRAEAATFIYNLHQQDVKIALRPMVQSPECAGNKQRTEDITVGGIMMYDTEAYVLDTRGEPDLRLTSQYGFTWYVYNDDYEDYVQVGIQDGKVVGLLTNARNWNIPDGPRATSDIQEVEDLYGKPLPYILKGNTRYVQSNRDGEQAVYERGDYYLTFYYDLHEDQQISAVQLIDQKVEQRLRGFYGDASDELARSYERQIFELANVVRTLRRLDAFEWDEAAARAARKHSRNMAEQGFFDHHDPARRSPFDRMKAEGITFSVAAENIASRQKDALEAHMDWMNSTTGHREALLGDYERLGVGVYLQDDGTPYYTQNFYTPYKLLTYH